MNKILLLGRLTKDPEIKFTKTNNVMIADFNLAVNRKYVKQGEERKADFINIQGYSKVAEFVSNYLKKGQQVVIVGRLQIRHWENENGDKKINPEVIAEEVYFADTRRDGKVDASILSGQPIAAIPESIENEDYSDSDDLPF